MLLARLSERFHELHEVKGALAILGDQPLEQKRDEVYPAVVALLVASLCEAAPEEPKSVVATLQFLHRELAHEPELAARLYAAIGDATVRHLQPELFRFIAAARDRRGIPLLRGGGAAGSWIDAVVALRAVELLDEVAGALDDEPTRELAAALGVLGGETRRADLERAPGGGGGVRLIGLALLASPGDRARFAELGRTPNETTARRIHTALAARGPKQRLDAVDELSAGITDATVDFGAERLLALTLAIGDRRADVAERAAAALAAYVKTRRPAIRTLFHALFLERAAEVVASGVTQAARTSLEIVRAAIPQAAPFGAAQVVAPPPTRQAAARARGREIIESLREPLAGPSAERRDPALEAVIAAAPDDRAAYLVYADWLQGVGDVRGTWITLQTTGGLAAREAIAAFLAEHRATLLGPLARHVIEEGSLELDWFMGFVRRATFRTSAAADAVTEALAALLDATCGAFVQELLFGDTGGERAVIELLLARRPQTLARLAFGTADAAPPELVQAIPRLLRDPRARWAGALARVAEQRALKLEIGAEDVPPLDPAVPGVTADMEAVLLGLKHELHLEKQLGVVAALREAFTRESVDRLARALGDLWLQRGRADRQRWAFDAAGSLGGDATARWLGSRLGDLGSRDREAAALGYLAQIGGDGAHDGARDGAHDGAIEQLAGAAFAPAAHPRLRAGARSTLEAMAARRGLGLDALISRAAPSGGDLAAAIQRAWLESLMVQGRGLPVADLQAGVRAHPLRLAMARALLWVERDGDVVIVLLRIDERGDLVRRGGKPYTPTHPIGLVHPAELTDDELAATRRVFAPDEQAILQVHRPLFAMTAGEARATELTRFAPRRVGFDPIATALRGRGWYVAANDVEDDDGEDRWLGTRAFARDFPRDGVRAVATLGDTRGSIASVTVHGIGNGIGNGGPRRFDELHAVTLSELLWDLETAHGRPADARPRPSPAEARPRPSAPPPPAAPAPSASTQSPASAPIVERAKSGRSRCVVCAAAIAKDSLRIGITRLIETPTFRGHATVWLHPACRDGAPELEGIDLDAALSQ